MSLAFNYQVPYIQQQRQMSCWLTALQMIDYWKFIQEVGMKSLNSEWVKMSLRCSEEFQKIGRATKPIRKKLIQSAPLHTPDGKKYPNTGVKRHEMIQLGESEGLEQIQWHNMTQYIEKLYNILIEFGPLLSAGHYRYGLPHAIVITGVLQAELPYPDCADEMASEWLLYNDPMLGASARMSFEDFLDSYYLLNEPGVMMGRKLD